jgi:hypothetical protein
MRTARFPAVTADSETWYLNGRPLTYAGHFYYPAGPRIHFNPDEMVLTGEYRGIPIYMQTTIEPYSVVFVPLDGGLMQPYERRRDGDLAGTSGSSAPSFPVATASDLTADEESTLREAPAPPETQWEDESMVPEPAATSGLGAAPNAAATSGRSAVQPSPATRRFVRRPLALNGIFVEYANAKWFSSGLPVAYDPARFVRIGDLDGFPVYADPKDGSTIFVRVVQGSTDAVAPYSKRTSNRMP